MTEDNSFTDEDLSRIRQKAFSSELKGLITKVTREVHPEDSVVVSNPLYSVSILFYKALNRSYLQSEYIDGKEFSSFTEESSSNSEVFYYDFEKSVYTSDSLKSLVPTKDFFRKLRKKKPFDYSFSGSFLKIFPFSGFTKIFDNEYFPPFAASPDSNFSKLTLINVLLRIMNNRKYESDFVNLSKILVQLSDYYDKVFLISLSKSGKLPESLYLLSRIKSIVESKCPDAEIVISSQGKMVLFADSASAEQALSLAVENEKVVFEEIKNVRNEIFSMFG
ncbi:MAG: hypothetical protein KA015_04965 [Spirochaetes bacterium]|nr:hypothetical protein [Spirochaetota bacterium]